jgi:hypothetical protein
VEDLLIPDSVHITWRTIFGFRSLQSLVNEWKEEKKKVERIANPF